MRLKWQTLALGWLVLGLGAVAHAQDIDPEAGREATLPDVPPPADILPTLAAPADSLWTQDFVIELLSVIDGVSAEGLKPESYAPDKLREALATNDPAQYGPLATAAWLKLAHDFGNGYVPNEARLDWHMEALADDQNVDMSSLYGALASGQIRDTLMGRLPTNGQYQSLKDKLAATPATDKDTIDRVRVSLERWRWMPRDFGSDYIFVNVPAFNVAMVRDGRALARHKVIVGKAKTPTPQLFVQATGVILNPTWTVPQSIIRESVGAMMQKNPKKARAQGYIMTRNEDGSVKVVQGPGTANALGAMKLVMPNPHSIYMHDTPAKSLFESKIRAFSHGCIRTDKALNFASVMLRGTPGWSLAKIEQTVAAKKTIKVELVKPVNVLITYLTAVVEDNGVLKTYNDIYGRDAPVVAALDQ
jgi:murein L,D-transpeptidase YcbB/YkuD